MKRKVISITLKQYLTAITAIFLLLSIISYSNAQDEKLAQPEEVISLVNNYYIPSTVAELTDLEFSDLADKWSGSVAGQCILEWTYSSKTNKVVPKDWIISVIKDNKIIGVIYSDPYSGDIIARCTGFFKAKLKRAKLLFNIPKDALRDSVAYQIGLEQSLHYLFDEIKLFFFPVRHYWLIPEESQILDKALFVPIDQLNKTLSFEQIKATKGGVQVIEEDMVELPAVFEMGKPEQLLSESKQSLIPHTGGSDMRMWRKVPIYDQRPTENCWAYCLAMVHQWWSPARLGKGDDQVTLIRNYLGKGPGDGASLYEVEAVIASWPYVHPDFEPWKSTWVGEGREIQVGAPSAALDDLKTWISYWESPVIVAIDTNEDGDADHTVVVTAYIDTYQWLYINEPFGALLWDVVDYDAFNGWWGSRWLGWPWNYVRGMVAGCPGDRKKIVWGDTGLKKPAQIYDDEKGEIYDIHMKVLNDNGGGGYDPWHHIIYYENLFEANLMLGETSTPVSNGTWYMHTPEPPADNIVFASRDLAMGQMLADALFNFRVVPQTSDNIYFKFLWKTWDEDDRTHFQEEFYPENQRTILVYDDRDGKNGFIEMPEPWRYQIRKEENVSINVVDDDTDYPIISNLGTDPSGYILETSQSNIKLYGDVVDYTSGICEVKFYYRYGSCNWFPKDYSGKSGNNYYYYIPRSEWIQHVSETITWYIKATDCDSDRNNDNLTKMSTDGPPVEIRPSQHTVSTPSTPSGLSSGEPNTSYTYTTGGSSCSQGHSVEYRFDWGDGTPYSNWSSSTSAAHSWSNPGTYTVKARARCSVDHSIFSDWSPGKTVTITYEVQPQLKVDPTSLDFGSLYTTKTFTIDNVGGGTLTWSITDDADWLTVSPASGYTTTEVDPITATVDRSGLVSGLYSATISITSNGGDEHVSVSMRVGEGEVIDLDQVWGDMRILGDDYNDLSGNEVAHGDINGDGYDDIIIGAAHFDDEGIDPGKTYVIFGSSNPPSTIDLNSQPADINIYGNDIDDWFGFAVASGDVNGDGYDDIIIGAPAAESDGHYEHGESYVIFGSSSPQSVIDLSTQPANITVYGKDEEDLSGIAVASGDINNDGYDDIIIGAPGAKPDGRTYAGETYVIFGSSSPPSVIDLSTQPANITVYGDDAEDLSGGTVASCDINNDGYDDIIISKCFPYNLDLKNAGKTYIIFGSINPPSTIDLSSQPADITILGAYEGDNLGVAVSNGDINNDGYEDIILGAPGADPSGLNFAGETYVIYGSSSLPSVIDLSTQPANITVYGKDEEDLSGIAVASGDINNDCYNDIIIGAPGAKPDGRTYAGETYVIYGSSSLPSTIDLNSIKADITVYGDDAGDASGFGLASGDVNADGHGDIIIGALGAEPGGRNYAGETYLILGGGPITVTSPVGGETWQAGTTQNITWTYQDLTGNVKIEFYKGGSLDSEITSSVPINDRSYSWPIPSDQTPGADYRVRITSLTDTSIWDESYNFTIAAHQIMVTSPHGGEEWQVGTTQNITWVYQDLTGNVKIELYKGGSFDSLIVDSVPIDSSPYPWPIPLGQTPATDYRVRITSLTDTSIWDESDNDFTITPPQITVTSPNGGESWPWGTYQTVTWDYHDLTGNVKLELYKGGSFDSEIASSVHILSSPHYWFIPSDQIPGTDYRVKITSLADTSIWDESDNDFTIKPPQITVTSPNGGEEWLRGTYQSITWNCENQGLTGNVKIELYKGGSFDCVIAYDWPINYSGFPWHIPNNQTPGTDYRVKITSTSDSSIWDESNGDFTITAPQITVTSPDSGETWQRGTNHDITWSYQDLTGNVKLELYKAGSLDSEIAASVSIDGSPYSWTIPSVQPGGIDYRVRITSLADGSIWDESNGDFTITAPQLKVDPTSLEFGYFNIAKTFTIDNVGDGILIWNITDDADWLTVSPISGDTTTEVDTITATIDRVGLTPGPYDATISIASNGGDQDIPVSMMVSIFDIISAHGKGGDSWVKLFEPDCTPIRAFKVFGSVNAQGEVQVAGGDVDADGKDELAAGHGEGGKSWIKFFEVDGSFISTFKAFGAANSGGEVHLAIGNFDTDLSDKEIAVAHGEGGDSWIKLFNTDGTRMRAFKAFSSVHNVKGEVHLAAGDLNKDGIDEIIAGMGEGGSSWVKVFNLWGAFIRSFKAFDSTENPGGEVHLAVGNFDADPAVEIAAATGYNGGNKVRLFDKDGSSIGEFTAFGFSGNPNGDVQIAAADIDNDGIDEIICGHGEGGSSMVKVFKADGTVIRNFKAFGGVNAQGEVHLGKSNY